jgi:hypothetical protein
VEKLFLEPHEYVVPPTTGHRFALEHYRGALDRDATPSFEEEGLTDAEIRGVRDHRPSL